MKQHNLTDKEIDLIVNAAYKDVSISERIKLRILFLRNSGSKRIFDEYRKTASSVKNIKSIELSEEVSNRVKARIGLHANDKRSFIVDLYSLIVMKPVMSGLMAVLLIATVATSLILNNNKISYNSYSEQEVRQAEIQTRQALDLVSSVLSKTSKKVKQDILTNTVSTEINKGINVVNQLFIEGEKK